MIWSIVQIVLALESTHPGLVFQRGKIMLLLTIVVLTLARAFNLRRWNADESGFKTIKEGRNSFQLLENIAGSGQRSQRKRFVVRRRSGKGTWSWITELGELKWGIHSRSDIVWFPDGGRCPWPSSQKLGHSRRCWLCKLKWFLLRVADWI